jgi:hypothetical protein
MRKYIINAEIDYNQGTLSKKLSPTVSADLLALYYFTKAYFVYFP